MSAYVVEDSTISGIVYTLEAGYYQATAYECRLLKEEGYTLDSQNHDADRLAYDMLALNIRAVCDRYQQDSEDNHAMHLLTFRYTPKEHWAPVRALKALRCYLYQCAEGDCPEDPLYKVLDRIANIWANHIICSLPEYDAAPWG